MSQASCGSGSPLRTKPLSHELIDRGFESPPTGRLCGIVIGTKDSRDGQRESRVPSLNPSC